MTSHLLKWSSEWWEQYGIGVTEWNGVAITISRHELISVFFKRLWIRCIVLLWLDFAVDNALRTLNNSCCSFQMEEEVKLSHNQEEDFQSYMGICLRIFLHCSPTDFRCLDIHDNCLVFCAYQASSGGKVALINLDARSMSVICRKCALSVRRWKNCYWAYFRAICSFTWIVVVRARVSRLFIPHRE